MSKKREKIRSVNRLYVCVCGCGCTYIQKKTQACVIVRRYKHVYTYIKKKSLMRYVALGISKINIRKNLRSF